jgi:hypothetical protein
MDAIRRPTIWYFNRIPRELFDTKEILATGAVFAGAKASLEVSAARNDFTVSELRDLIAD